MLSIFSGYSGQNFPLVVRLVVLFSCMLLSIFLYIIWKKKTKPFFKKKNKILGKESPLYKTLNLINIISIVTLPIVGLIFIFI